MDSYDVLINDRFEYYYNNQIYYFCEDICNAQSIKIDLHNSRIECVCTGKSNFTTYNKQNFQKHKKYSQNCKDTFLQFFKCYKNVFTKNLFKNNIGNFFISSFIVVQIGSLLLFFILTKSYDESYT